MKNRITPFVITAFAMVAMSSIAPAAILAQWINRNIALGEVEPEPWNFGDNVSVSNLTLHGAIQLYESGSYKAVYTGWSTTLDYNNYVGFTITPDEGFQMELTEWKATIQEVGNGVGIARWGYRIDTDNDGAYDTEWVLLTEVGGTALTIDALNITTTGTVEFGFFGTSDPNSEPGYPYWGPVGPNTRNNSELTGTVTAVPEPSAALLACFGGLVAFRRRR